jgi:hypothetical protein
MRPASRPVHACDSTARTNAPARWRSGTARSPRWRRHRGPAARRPAFARVRRAGAGHVGGHGGRRVAAGLGRAAGGDDQGAPVDARRRDGVRATRTPLVARGRATGPSRRSPASTCSSGQAQRQFEHWTGRQPPTGLFARIAPPELAHPQAPAAEAAPLPRFHANAIDEARRGVLTPTNTAQPAESTWSPPRNPLSWQDPCPVQEARSLSGSVGRHGGLPFCHVPLAAKVEATMKTSSVSRIVLSLVAGSCMSGSGAWPPTVPT